MKVIGIFKRLLASGNDQHGRHLFKWGNRWNIIGFNFTERDALSSVYKISMVPSCTILVGEIWFLLFRFIRLPIILLLLLLFKFILREVP